MTRVIDNLLQNAAKFTAAGSVTLSCKKDDSKRRLRIRVADTGIGIDPDKREWVFERFAKVDPFKPGSGIGLYLCRLIVTRRRNPRLPRIPRRLLHRYRPPLLKLKIRPFRADFSYRTGLRIAIRS